MQLTGNSQIRTIIALQFGVALAIGLVLLVFGKATAWSGLIGGLIAALANGYFAYRSFTRYRAQEPERLARRMLGAEIQKLLLTGLMFVLAIVYISPLNMGALLGSYLVIQVVVPLVATLFQDRQQS
ncbi:MAG: ATP synthase subunit I [Candidatus Thiodiazotropha sp. (ex Gloverina cf. vestifex)]|nr:ATP synthase subunit I [Candidatus Thiodiazotropha sp. (ex Gloverina cf. vestifex)]